MEVQLGTTTIHLSNLNLYKKARLIEATRVFRRRVAARAIYHWDCRTQKGTPDSAFRKNRVEPAIQFATLDALGRPNLKAGIAVFRRLAAAAGFRNPAELNAALLKVFPALEYTAPIEALLQPYKARYSVSIHERTQYANFLARPLSGRMSDYFILALPVRVVWQCITLWDCKLGSDKERGLPLGEETRLELDQSKAGARAIAEFYRQQSEIDEKAHAKALKKAEKARENGR